MDGTDKTDFHRFQCKFFTNQIKESVLISFIRAIRDLFLQF